MGSTFNRPTLRPVTVCGRKLTESAHICAFFDSGEQELDCLAPYFGEGLEHGDQLITIRDASDLQPYHDALAARLPMSLDEAARTRQLRAFASEDTYLKGDSFGEERVSAMLLDLLREAEAGPFKRVRTCADMNWALRDIRGTDELMVYEARVNLITREHDCTFMCTYDVNKFSGRAVMDVLATHPMVIMGDRIYDNPYYVPPEAFLTTLLRRGDSPLARERLPA